MDNATVVIPCRAGSTRVPNKNFKKFADTTLLDIKVKQAKTLGFNIIINSDSDVAEKTAIKQNIGFHRRPDYYASSECINSDYYDYLGRSVPTEYIIILQPTAPLLKDETLKECVDEFFKNTDKYDSLVTCDFAKKFAWYNGKPINYNVENMPNSQDLDPIIMPTYNIMICKVSELIKHKNVITEKCLFYEIDESESLEIDTPLEFDIAEILYERNK